MGLIPAHAGKTCPENRRCRATWAHPRSRGENMLTARSMTCPTGSSPLTRGKPSCIMLFTRCMRLIPAHAGKTRVQDVEHAAAGAHPRSRGENLNAVAGGNKETGSSPLTRGKHRHLVSDRVAVRLIPAHAGKTARRAGMGADGGAHPRSRGENREGVQQIEIVEGSSPLTRGKPHGIDRRHCAVGLIPAHAGKTARRAGMGADGGAHPRSRGENDLAVNGNFDGNGSSPLTRGKPALSS